MTNDIQHLLKPRYRVIADYPGNDMGPVGTILDRNWTWYKNDDENTGQVICRVSDFPHLFQPLKWWEERKPEDFQKVAYVMEVVGEVLDMGSVHPVNSWRFNLNPMVELDAGRFNPSHFIPCSLSDYEQYKQSH